LQRFAKLLGISVLVLATARPGAAQQAGFTPEPTIPQALLQEETEHSHVMEIAAYLTDVYGPRLTNSPNIREAAQYAQGLMTSWGLTRVHSEVWGPFGRGWANEFFQASEVSPRQFPLIAYPKAWTPGTNGTVTADAVFAKIQKEDDFNDYRGRLKGKFVLTAAPVAVEAHFEALAHRYTDQELGDLAQPRPEQPPADPAVRERQAAQRKFNLALLKFLTEQRAAAWLEPSSHDGGTVTVMDGGPRDPKGPIPLPRVAIAAEHYNRIVRDLQKNVATRLQIQITNRFYDDDPNSFNLIGEITGNAKPQEVVMLGAHFDSWHSGTGATDNAAGCSVILEAMRLLKVSGVKMKRTVRMALWTGEEEGLLGSRAYVKEHFADRQTMQTKPEHAAISAYYNVDNGTGKIRGIYMQGNEGLRTIFSPWIEPLKSLGMSKLSIRGTGGTDHVAFEEVGIPAFQFMQDPIEYETRTHHTNMDVYDRLQEADLKQMAVVVASFVYWTANADEMLPRKPLPSKPSPPNP
jgi:carboxypeptidase Q